MRESGREIGRQSPENCCARGRPVLFVSLLPSCGLALFLGLDASRPRKKSSIQLVQPFIDRNAPHAGIFSLVPLASREPVGADSFIDEDGLYQQAEFRKGSQGPDPPRSDRLPNVDIVAPKSACMSLRTCFLPLDEYRVHLHGDAQSAAAIPTIITLSPIERGDFECWVTQAQTDGFFHAEDALEMQLAQGSEKRDVSRRSKASSSYEPVKRKDMQSALSGLLAQVRGDVEASNLFCPPPPQDSDAGMTLTEVERNLKAGLYDHDMSLQHAEGEAERTAFTAPIRRLLSDVAQVWRDTKAAQPGKLVRALCKTAYDQWYDQISKQGGLLRQLEEERQQHARQKQDNPRTRRNAEAAAAAPADGGEEEEEEEGEADERTDASSEGEPGSAGAAAPSMAPASPAAASASRSRVDPAVAAAQLNLQHIMQLAAERDTLKQCVQRAKFQILSLQRSVEQNKRLKDERDRQAKALRAQLGEAAAAAPSARLQKELEQARATIAERNAELERLRQSSAADLTRVREEAAAAQSAHAALQRQVEALEEDSAVLQSFRERLNTPRRARPRDCVGDDAGPPSVRRRLEAEAGLRDEPQAEQKEEQKAQRAH